MKTLRISGFYSRISAIAARNFIELKSGRGSVHALKIRRDVQNPEQAYALVQFDSDLSADIVLKWGNNRQAQANPLSDNLFFQEARYDIIKNPKDLLLNLEGIDFHMGYKASEVEFISFWQVEGAVVNFRSEKMDLFLEYNQAQYNLELHISSILMSLEQDDDKYFIMIELQSAPRIYKKAYQKGSHIYDTNVCDYFKDMSDQNWVRTVDFTPSSLIGQATSFGLRILHGHLPEIKALPYSFRKNREKFHLKKGSPYCSGVFVPVVECASPLIFSVIFKVNSLVQHGILVGPLLDSTFYKLLDTREVSLQKVEYGLENLSKLKNPCYEPVKFLQVEYRDYECRKPSSSLKIGAFLSDDGSVVGIYKIHVTPSRVYFSGPEAILSNRVLRNYPHDLDNFARVSFVDEDREKIKGSDLVDYYSKEKSDIYDRILFTLRNGIEVGGKVFKFLAFSPSQLKNQSLWMFAERDGLLPLDIRNWMGDFSEIKNVAKYGARLGLSLGASRGTLSVEDHECEIIQDIISEKYIFSDGIGKISIRFAKEIANEYGIRNRPPSAFQIRYRGYKGVVAISPRLAYKLSLRDSMKKFESDNKIVDVLNYSRYQACYLNRQIIILLSTIKVPDHVFENKQKRIIDELAEIFEDPQKAKGALDLTYVGENARIVKDMLNIGYIPREELFLGRMLGIFRDFKLTELRNRGRIFLPLGRCLMGCMDETDTLKYGEAFIQISRSDNPTLEVITSRVIVAKNPCLHPGDIRVLKGIDVLALRHMVGVVVFPQRGPRPHPNECSGSDLDGDVYFVCWDVDLILPEEVPPMDYDTLVPKSKSSGDPIITYDEDFMVKELEEFFAGYAITDNMGKIANAHLVFADKEKLKAKSKKCLALAELFSKAVDSVKTGIRVDIPKELHVSEYPNFMQKADKPMYESTQILGKLYRATKQIPFDMCYDDQLINSYNRDLEYAGFEVYVGAASDKKEEYDLEIQKLMHRFGRKTEEDIMSFGIFEFKLGNKNSDAIIYAVKSLIDRVRQWFEEGMDTHDIDKMNAKASAWYYVTYHPSYSCKYKEKGLSRPFVSFPWVIHHKLIPIKKKNHSSMRISF